jgi:serine/threonine protein kinase
MAATLATAAGHIVRTPSYMSPEQAEGRHVDQGSDIFSMGILLYELASERRPLRGDSTLSTLSTGSAPNGNLHTSNRIRRRAADTSPVASASGCSYQASAGVICMETHRRVLLPTS